MVLSLSVEPVSQIKARTQKQVSKVEMLIKDLCSKRIAARKEATETAIIQSD